MRYYSSWQAAFMDFIELFGREFPNSYTLAEEFELHLQQNINGAYFMRLNLK